MYGCKDTRFNYDDISGKTYDVDVVKKNDTDHITKTCLFKYTENFTTKKWKFPDKKFW